MLKKKALLVAVTLLVSVTMARYSGEPAVAKLLMVNVGLVAPETLLLLLRLLNELPPFVETSHCTVNGPVPPLTATVKDLEAD